MATTTNYSWTTPNDTDLVKDGAAAIRSLGTAIDTTVFNNAGAAISKTIVDAKGDLIVATAADTVARLASSATNGDLLTVDTTTASGLKWAAPAAGGMTLLDTVTLSGSSTTSNTFSSAYNQILVFVSGAYASAEGLIQLRINGDTGTNYSFVLVNAFSSVTFDYQVTGSVIWCGYLGTSSSDLQKLNGLITITNPSQTSEVFVNAQSLGRASSNPRWFVGNGVYNNSAVVTQLTFLPTSGTFSAGTAYIYGVK
jgi:hypothetical protein